MHRFVAMAIAGTLLASCQAGTPTTLSRAVDTHEAMVGGINPAALAIWDVGNKATSDTGAWDPALMDQAAWARLQGAARLLEHYSRRMAEADILYVGDHNDAIEGFATKAEIQAMIDADPAGFRELSLKMADDARELLDAATARNLRRSTDMVDAMSENCAACHSRYWEKPVS
jgi:hypothetical protein